MDGFAIFLHRRGGIVTARAHARIFDAARTSEATMRAWLSRAMHQ